MLFLCEQKFMFVELSFLVKANPILAVKYVKKYDNFEGTSLMSVKENFMVCSTLVDMSYVSYTKK